MVANENDNRIAKTQSIRASIALWLTLGAITLVNMDISRVLSRILAGIIVGCTATLIGYYVVSLPRNLWNPLKRRMNIASFLYTLYALFIYALSMSISQGSLFGTKLGTSLGFNVTFIVLAAFILGSYLNIGIVFDKALSDAEGYLWLAIIGVVGIYAFTAGLAIAGFSFDFLFLVSLAVSRLVSSFAFSKILQTTGDEDFSALRIRLLVVNMLVLPLTALLSK